MLERLFTSSKQLKRSLRFTTILILLQWNIDKNAASESEINNKQSFADSPLMDNDIRIYSSYGNGHVVYQQGSSRNWFCSSSGIVNVSDPFDCTRYIYCERGIGLRHKCPYREIFDLNESNCVVNRWPTC